MTRAQDVLDYIDAVRGLAEREPAYLDDVMNERWGKGGVLLHYDYRRGPTHLRILSASRYKHEQAA